MREAPDRGVDVVVLDERVVVALLAEPLAGGGQSIESMLRHGEYEEDPIVLRDRKGGDPAEWPEDLRVRQFPEARHVP